MSGFLKRFGAMLLCAGAMIPSACVRDSLPDCPPLRVTIAVKDKNYFNVDQMEHEERVAEDLPFRNYVPTLYWVLANAETGEVVETRPLYDVTGDATTVTAEFPAELPFGRYRFTVWGGMPDESPLGDNPATVDFHPGNTPGSDIYMTSDIIDYDYAHGDHTVELERTKGKLIVEKIGLPAEVTGSEKSVTGLFATVDTTFTYSGATSVKKPDSYTPESLVVTKTILSPSVREKGSQLMVLFPKSSGEPLSAESVNITMERNKLTAVRYVWDETTERFTIYVYINSNWEAVSSMEVD